MRKLALTLVLVAAAIALLAVPAQAQVQWPPNPVTFNPDPVDFGVVPYGAVASQKIVVTNPNNYDITFSTYVPAGAFFVGTSSFTVPANGFTHIQVFFAPPSGGNFNSYLKISAFNGVLKQTVGLHGIGYLP